MNKPETPAFIKAHSAWVAARHLGASAGGQEGRWAPLLRWEGRVREKEDRRASPSWRQGQPKARRKCGRWRGPTMVPHHRSRPQRPQRSRSSPHCRCEARCRAGPVASPWPGSGLAHGQPLWEPLSVSQGWALCSVGTKSAPHHYPFFPALQEPRAGSPGLLTTGTRLGMLLG